MTNPISPRKGGGDCLSAPSLSELLDHDPELLAAAYAPVNWMIDQLWAGCGKTPDVEWLERAGPIARRLNEESKRD